MSETQTKPVTEEEKQQTNMLTTMKERLNKLGDGNTVCPQFNDMIVPKVMKGLEMYTSQTSKSMIEQCILFRMPRRSMKSSMLHEIAATFFESSTDLRILYISTCTARRRAILSVLDILMDRNVYVNKYDNVLTGKAINDRWEAKVQIVFIGPDEFNKTSLRGNAPQIILVDDYHQLPLDIFYTLVVPIMKIKHTLFCFVGTPPPPPLSPSESDTNQPKDVGRLIDLLESKGVFDKLDDDVTPIEPNANEK